MTSNRSSVTILVSAVIVLVPYFIGYEKLTTQDEACGYQIARHLLYLLAAPL
jgi:hypothetical protein